MPLEARVAVLCTRVETLLDQYEDHERRIRSVERYRWMLAGALALAMILVGAILR